MKSKNKKPNRQSEIFQMLGHRFTMYHPDLFKVTGSVNATLLLCHLLYWQDKGSQNGWIYKTVNELYLDIGLTKNNQATAIARLKELDVIEVKLKQIPARRHFKIKMPQLTGLILDKIKSGEIVVEKDVNQLAANQPTITETTSRDYTENNGDVNYEGLGRLNQLKKKLLSKKPIGVLATYNIG